MKQLLLLFLFSVNLINSQNWTTSSTSQSDIIDEVSVVNDDVIWIMDQATSNGFSISTDGGVTWTHKNFPAQFTNDNFGTGVLSAVDANTAYIIVSTADTQSLAGLYKTLDAGNTWTRESAIFNNASSFPDQVHFWDANNGFAMGDGFEIFVYQNGTWYNQTGSLPATTGGYSLNSSKYLRIVGDSAYFMTNIGSILKTNNKGISWSEIITPYSAFNNLSFDFKDDLNGLLVFNDNVTNVLYTTFDGGLTWNYSGTNIPNLYNTIKYIPSLEIYFSTSNDNSVLGLSSSDEYGLTWTVDTELQNIFLGEIESSNKKIFFGGNPNMYYQEPDFSNHPDYDALVAFYNATGGDNWTNNTNWLDPNKPIYTWHGVYSQSFDGQQRVTDIDAGSNNLTGAVPTEILNLPYLRGLGIYSNNLSNSIPDLSSLPLEELYITGNNYVFGDFENEFTNYLALGSSFEYQSQNLTETPTNEAVAIGSSTSLASNISGAQNNYQWYKDGVLLSGETNATLNLTINTAADYGDYYYLATSNIVTGLTLQSYNFTIGEAPTSSPDYAALVALYNSTNGDNWTNNTNWLDNTMPLSTWHGVILTNGRVSQLWLGGNNLTGTIPTEIGDFSELLRLFLWSNQLTGSIPPEIGNLTKLIEMDLSPNTFSGSIPPEIGNLINLEVLWLNQNGLSGNIPTSFQNLTKLRQLYLIGGVSFNSEFNSSVFSGDFPDLTALPLEVLRLDYNFFTFTNIADEFATYQANIPDFVFNPQFTVDTPVETNSAIGSDITLTLTDVPSTAKGMKTKRSLASNTYQWYKDDLALTANANSDTYTIINAQISDSGVYYCEITNTDVPGMIIKRQTITLNIGALSVDKNDLNMVNIYPNPTINILNIKLNNYNKADAKLYDISGRLVLKKKLQTEQSIIDIKNLNAGMYMLQIKTENKTTTKHIIKQ